MALWQHLGQILPETCSAVLALHVLLDWSKLLYHKYLSDSQREVKNKIKKLK